MSYLFIYFVIGRYNGDDASTGDDIIGKYHSEYQKCYFPFAGVEVEIPFGGRRLPESPENWRNCEFLVDDYEEFGFF